MYAKLASAISTNRRLWITLLVFAGVAVLIKISWSPSSAKSPDFKPQERAFKLHREYKKMPLEVRAVRNLQSDEWLKDLEIEVKNTGKKPIYFILGYLLFPDDKSAEKVGVRLMYGKSVNEHRLSDPDDPHLDPGESYIFKIDSDFQKSFDEKVKAAPSTYKRVELWLTIISFGDGTSFENGEEQDYRNKSPTQSGLDDPSKKKNHLLDHGGQTKVVVIIGYITLSQALTLRH